MEIQWRARADTGCRVSQRLARRKGTRAQHLHYLTKRQQRNVDNETTYKTSAMKQPKRSGLAWSHGRDAALLRAVSSRSSTTGTWWSLASALPCLQGLQYRTQCAGAWQLASIEASATQHGAIETGSPVHGQSFRDLQLGKQMTFTYSQDAQS